MRGLAPDIAGQATALMLAIGRQDEAQRLEGAVDRALADSGPGRTATMRQ